MPPQAPEVRHDLNRQRSEALRHLDQLLDRPMMLLSFVWLALMILDLTQGLGHMLSIVRYAIWGLFVLHFLLEFALAPHKLAYLRGQWLTALALLIPAVRILRVFRVVSLIAAHTAGGEGLLRILAGFNRGLNATRGVLGHRRLGAVVGFTALVIFLGAAGMLQFESPAALRQAGLNSVVQSGGGLHNYGEATWWTAMILTTIGSDYFPQTANGRILGWLLAIYSVSVAGYLTASVASYFVGAEKERKQERREERQPAAGGANEELTLLRTEIQALRQQIALLSERLPQRE